MNGRKPDKNKTIKNKIIDIENLEKERAWSVPKVLSTRVPHEAEGVGGLFEAWAMFFS